jgi:hypothetical protein
MSSMAHKRRLVFVIISAGNAADRHNSASDRTIQPSGTNWNRREPDERFAGECTEHAGSHGIEGPRSSFGPWFMLIAPQAGVSLQRSYDVAVNSKGRENQH